MGWPDFDFRLGQEFFSSPPCPDRLQGSHSLLFNGYRWLFLGSKAALCLHLFISPHDVTGTNLSFFFAMASFYDRSIVKKLFRVSYNLLTWFSLFYLYCANSCSTGSTLSSSQISLFFLLSVKLYSTVRLVNFTPAFFNLLISLCLSVHISQRYKNCGIDKILSLD
jgi:hypothetical protein